MDGYSTAVFIFLAYVVGQLTFFLVPSFPVSILAASSAVALVAILYWHWTQFSVEYRMSTWQEGLRNYASYFLIFIVILLSYGFYVFSANGGSVSEVLQKAQTTVRNVSRNTLNRSSRALNSVSESLNPSEPSKNVSTILPSFSLNAPPTANQQATLNQPKNFLY